MAITTPAAPVVTDDSSTPDAARPASGGWSTPAAAAPLHPRRLLDAVRARLRQGTRAIGLYDGGTAALVTALVLGVVGWPTHWIELRIAAVLCLVLVVLALAFTLYGTKYTVDLQLSQPRVVVGEPASGAVHIANSTGRRALPARVDVPVGEQIATFQVPSLPTRAAHDGTFTIPTERRGVVVVGPVRTVRGDPFGLSGRETQFTDTLEVFVHPRTVPLPGRQAGFVHDLEGHPSSTLAASDVSFHALREYVPGDDRRHVHWRSTARAGSLMVRQYEETRQSHLAIGVDLGSESWFSEAEFEDAVSIAASVAGQAWRESNPLTVFAGPDRVPSVNLRRTLDELSRLERRPDTGFHDLVHTLRLRATSASVVVLVTGSGMPLQRVRAGCASLDVDTRVIAVQVDESAEPIVRTVANVSVIRLSRLSELPSALRRAVS